MEKTKKLIEALNNEIKDYTKVVVSDFGNNNIELNYNYKSGSLEIKTYVGYSKKDIEKEAELYEGLKRWYMEYVKDYDGSIKLNKKDIYEAYENNFDEGEIYVVVVKQTSNEIEGVSFKHYFISDYYGENQLEEIVQKINEWLSFILAEDVKARYKIISETLDWLFNYGFDYEYTIIECNDFDKELQEFKKLMLDNKQVKA